MSISQSEIDALLAGAGGAPAPTPQAPAADPPAQPPAESPAAQSAPVPRRPAPAGLSRLLGLEVAVSVILAERPMDVQTILDTNVGTIIEFDKASDSALTLCVGNRPIATGFAVKIGENFGLRVAELHSMADRIEAMGPHSH